MDEFEAEGETIRLHDHALGDVAIVAAQRFDRDAQPPLGFTFVCWYQGTVCAWKVLTGEDSITWPSAEGIQVKLVRRPH